MLAVFADHCRGKAQPEVRGTLADNALKGNRRNMVALVHDNLAVVMRDVRKLQFTNINR
jgi:hypothetical protein